MRHCFFYRWWFRNR